MKREHTCIGSLLYTLGVVWALGMVLLPGSEVVAQEAPGGDLSGSMNTALVFASLAIIPLVLIVVTCFAKLAIVLGFLRSGLGLQQILPTSVVTALAVVLSAVIMAPVGLAMVDAAGDISADAAQIQARSGAIAAPLQSWLGRHAGATEREALAALAEQLHEGQNPQWSAPDHPLVLVPAFALTELKEAFIIGVLILVPFLVLDIVVANVLLTVGVQGLSPTIVSLPFKLLLFVLIDGWTLLVQGLIMGYVPSG